MEESSWRAARAWQEYRVRDRGGFVTAGLDDFLFQTRSTRDFGLLDRYRPIVLGLAKATGIPD